MGNTSYDLVCPFLNESPDFAYGVEFGMLFAKMRKSDEDVIQDYFCRQNQESILLLANRLGWNVEELEPWDKFWFWCVLKKAGARLTPDPP